MTTLASAANKPTFITWVTAPLAMVVEFFSTIYFYREYLYQSVARDLRKRYKRSVLGYLWSMLNPLLMMTIIAVVFSNLMRGKVENYAVYLFAGMLPYRFFQSTITESMGSIAGNINIMKQMPIPKYIFPISFAISNLVDYLLSLIPLFIVMLVMGHSFSTVILLFPIMIPALFCLSMGIALVIAVSYVFFHDTQHLTGVMLQALYYMCPIIYTIDMLPKHLLPYFKLNPMFGMTNAIRDIFYAGLLPSVESFLTINLVSLVFLMLGLILFNKTSNKFIYFV